MKTYILTFHGSVNYGAVLQATALYTTVVKLRSECTVIDYNRRLHHYNYLRVNAKEANVKGLIYQIMQLPRKFVVHVRFNRFIKKHVQLTKKCYDGEGALCGQSFSEESRFIVGSDQVWNCDLTRNNMHYFLDFTKSQEKYAYAASFGRDSIEDGKNIVSLLSEFKKISVREETGQRIMEQLVGEKVEVVCDPIFLLSAKEWEQKIAKKSLRKKYVLLFMLSYDEKLECYARQKALELELQFVNIVYQCKRVDKAKNIFASGPEQWLFYIKNAEYVFTNSFHGFAFSLCFGKKVKVALSNNGRNSRILDMACRYEAQDCILKEVEENESEKILDYVKICTLIEEDREQALDFLREVLNESN